MSAGGSILHSEYNLSSEEPVRFLQICLQPTRLDVAPGYAQKHMSAGRIRGRAGEFRRRKLNER